jgi:hypothetical protein
VGAVAALGLLMSAPTLAADTINGPVDPAGNVWAANNWNNPEAAVYSKVPHAISTEGGGSGFTVIYGVAAPVKAPSKGQVRPN